jgi:hypothetical protein
MIENAKRDKVMYPTGEVEIRYSDFIGAIAS